MSDHIKSQVSMKKLLTLAILCFLFYPNYSQKKVDLKGAALFGNIQARHLGPAIMSGRVIDIEGHPEDGNILYVGSAGGGVWKTSDGGITFNPIFDDYIQSIGCVAVDPTNPDKEIWVGTGEGNPRNSQSYGYGMYKSLDGGKTWSRLQITQSPRGRTIYYVEGSDGEGSCGTYILFFGSGSSSGMAYSRDDGKTWTMASEQPVFTLSFIDANTGFSGGMIYEGGNGGLYKWTGESLKGMTECKD